MHTPSKNKRNRGTPTPESGNPAPKKEGRTTDSPVTVARHNNYPDTRIEQPPSEELRALVRRFLSVDFGTMRSARMNLRTVFMQSRHAVVCAAYDHLETMDASKLPPLEDEGLIDHLQSRGLNAVAEKLAQKSLGAMWHEAIQPKDLYAEADGAPELEEASSVAAIGSLPVSCDPALAWPVVRQRWLQCLELVVKQGAGEIAFYGIKFWVGCRAMDTLTGTKALAHPQKVLAIAVANGVPFCACGAVAPPTISLAPNQIVKFKPKILILVQTDNKYAHRQSSDQLEGFSSNLFCTNKFQHIETCNTNISIDQIWANLGGNES